MDSARDRKISVVTCMELVQRSRNRAELREIKSFLSDFGFEILPLSENVGHRAAIYHLYADPSSRPRSGPRLLPPPPTC